ncbi:MAG TPA: DUF2505 family protein [Labilithrix sp.]|jgi:hypothetical protein|nr:DUF2505 family protein [Labilithrix sp.]
MPELTLRHEFNTDEDTYWSKIVLDQAFNKKMFEGELGFSGWNLVEFKEDDAKISRKIHVEPPSGNLPGPIKKLVGDRVTYTEDGVFDKKAKRYSFKITPSTLADKMKLNGEFWVERIADKKICRVCRVTVEVKVFAVGGAIEERILADMRTSYDRGSSFTNQHIAEHGL